MTQSASSITFFVKTVIQHYKHILKPDSNFADKATSQAIIKRWFKKPEDAASDASNIFLQRRMRLEVVDELVEMVGSCPYFASNYLAKFFYCWKNIIPPHEAHSLA